jgi:hypothetical protein
MTGAVYPKAGLGSWTGRDDIAPSGQPPMGLAPRDVPQLFSIGFDDNSRAGSEDGRDGGVHWALEMMRGRTNPVGRGQAATFDGAPARLSFYVASSFLESSTLQSPAALERAWRTAADEGHEIGNHTHSHVRGRSFGTFEWRAEIERCAEHLSRLGLSAAGRGFRAPYLEYGDSVFTALATLGFHYDCSIEDGWQSDMDGTTYRWPYTLDRGCPAFAAIRPHPGLWELPAHPVIVPPDEACERYGVPRGLRARLKARDKHFDEATGKITGFDYNLWVAFRMTKAEFLATVKHTLDLRLAGNRAPFLLGAHTDYYSSDYTDAPSTTAEERRSAMEEIVAYALDKPEVRLVSLGQVLDWVRNPAPLTQGSNRAR